MPDPLRRIQDELRLFMEGLEEGEPPFKRFKESGDEIISSDNFYSYLFGFICGTSPLRDPMPPPLPSQGDGEMIGTKGIIKKQEFVKIITRALYSLGYDRSGALLEEESGIPLHPPVVGQFIKQVLDGQWDASVTTLHKIGVPNEVVKSASFLILEQKFLDLLQKGKASDALNMLRNEIAPLDINVKRVQELAACVVLHSNTYVSTRSEILRKLEKVLPPEVIIPERRLEHLVEKALDLQKDSCVFHNILDTELSLYTDHQCGRNMIPSHTLQILEGHRDEVWYLQFSHNGRYLASTSKDQSAVVWEVNENGDVSPKHLLVGHQKPVCVVSWSPDDHQLLTCGQEEVVRCWDVNTGECLHVYEISGVGLISCGWFPDGKGVLSGGTDKSIYFWCDGRESELKFWDGQMTLKISEMAITSDGKKIMCGCRKNTIRILDGEAELERDIEEDQEITSFSLSNDNRFLLVNLINEEIHLWSLEGDPKIVSEYNGHKCTRFIIRSCFGGYDQAFIASGSEDSQVYIWGRSTGELLVALPGHSGAVNCVSWNPANPHMLASASDDCTIRIWGLDPIRSISTNDHISRR